MSNVRILWDNKADDATITSSSEHRNFPDDNVTHRWHTRSWRTRYGAGSGWGTFFITLNENDKIDFNEGGGEIIATFTPGTYNADSLASHIGTTMTARSLAVGAGWTYVCTYSNATNKFTIAETSGPNAFSILWLTGTNGSTGTGQTIGNTIGFNELADSIGVSHTADYMRIHSLEYIKFDLGSAQNIQAFVLKFNNFQSDATIRVQGNSTDAWAAPAANYVFGAIDNDIMVYFWASVQAYRYWRVTIQDVDNPDGYIEIGRIFLGGYFSPTRGPKNEFSDVLVDPSDVLFSKGGQISSNEEEEFKTYDLTFPMASADLSTFNSIYEDRGQRKDMFVCIDTDNYATETYYMRFASSRDVEHIGNREEYWMRIRVEELR